MDIKIHISRVVLTADQVKKLADKDMDIELLIVDQKDRDPGDNEPDFVVLSAESSVEDSDDDPVYPISSCNTGNSGSEIHR